MNFKSSPRDFTQNSSNVMSVFLRMPVSNTSFKTSLMRLHQ